MNEWGVPDWRDRAAYGDYEAWTINRWRWEFYRRRHDLRADFDEAIGPDAINMTDFFNEGLSPDDPGFVACIPDPRRYGYLRLPNPRIGDQPEGYIFPTYDHAGVSYTLGSGARPSDFYDPNAYRMEVCEGQAGVRFDLEKPLAPQFEAAKQALEREQERRLGQVLRAPRTPNDKAGGKLAHEWLQYLRVLDAADEMGDGIKGAWAVLEVQGKYADKTAARALFRKANSLREKF
ncbi:hypothetical protein [uncultured Paracoccus sp.]|uniref:hypothetical protein n=1 Tax=uncultured Paracoccus sp. TaxID=189685 RepID=UPI0025F4DF98|nr:hypothetical protein [uncultured Paracoccus sp.]